MSEGQTTIRVRDCSCEGSPHPDGDTVELAPELSLTGGMAAQGAIYEAEGDSVVLQEQLARVWVTHGVIGWNLLDASGKPKPLSPQAVLAEFPWMHGGMEIAEACDSLYQEAVVSPLLSRLARLAARGSTVDTRKGTSAKKGSTRRRSKRSSTGSTATEPTGA